MGAKFVPIILCIIIFSARTLNADHEVKHQDDLAGDVIQAIDTEKTNDQVEKTEKNSIVDGHATDTEEVKDVEKVEETKTQANTEKVKDEVEQDGETTADYFAKANTEVKDEVEQAGETTTDVQATGTENVQDEAEKVEETTTDDAGQASTEKVKNEVEQDGETTTNDSAKANTEVKDEVEQVGGETITDVQATGTEKVKDEAEKVEEITTADAGQATYTENVKKETGETTTDDDNQANTEAGETTTDDVGQTTDTDAKDEVEKAEETQTDDAGQTTDTAKVKDKVETTLENLVFECELCFKDQNSEQVYDISAHGCKSKTFHEKEHDWIMSRDTCPAVGVLSCKKCIETRAFFWNFDLHHCGDFKAYGQHVSQPVRNCEKPAAKYSAEIAAGKYSAESSTSNFTITFLIFTTLFFLF